MTQNLGMGAWDDYPAPSHDATNNANPPDSKQNGYLLLSLFIVFFAGPCLHHQHGVLHNVASAEVVAQY